MVKGLRIPNELLASSVMQSIKDTEGYNDEEFYDKFSISKDMFHYHAGESSQIAWNDIQAISYINKYSDRPNKIAIPRYPTEGYNQHSHTSEYDGGIITGMLGVHTHKSSKQMDGGLCYAILAPSTGVPLADWN